MWVFSFLKDIMSRTKPILDRMEQRLEALIEKAENGTLTEKDIEHTKRVLPLEAIRFGQASAFDLLDLESQADDTNDPTTDLF